MINRVSRVLKDRTIWKKEDGTGEVAQNSPASQGRLEREKRGWNLVPGRDLR